ncbi:hypothetical protein SAMN04489835_1626 [Mycolicibacterium rutilum]|uniref:Uncharacterized protein n=1 Tax=Mycolicibacterium rutilum TaxID=370526 RepID=A0A1H6JB94_MYCRU|nr:hypothetical protein [Mycolicibacterium rutilum]SEH57658.1 hypothetical protein SAMN04489835_1626 [Mycolicibacterium rutilum]
MTIIQKRLIGKSRTTSSTPALGDAHATRKPILITVQEVLFGSAAALRARRTPKPPKPRRDYPQHIKFLEQASMAREMYRL